MGQLKVMSVFLVFIAVLSLCFADTEDKVCGEDVIELLDRDDGKGVVSFKISVIDVVDNSKVLGTYCVSVPEGTNLFSAMEELQKHTEGEFNYEVKEFPKLGHYIQSMYGIEADQKAETYWMIYNGQDQLPVGVDGYFPKDGDHIIFKYEMVHHEADTHQQHHPGKHSNEEL